MKDSSDEQLDRAGVTAFAMGHSASLTDAARRSRTASLTPPASLSLSPIQVLLVLRSPQVQDGIGDC